MLYFATQKVAKKTNPYAADQKFYIVATFFLTKKQIRHKLL